MSQIQFRIRTLMIAVALTAVILTLIGVGMRWWLYYQDFHIHDTYIWFGPRRSS
jgi:hypothetical protein